MNKKHLVKRHGKQISLALFLLATGTGSAWAQSNGGTQPGYEEAEGNVVIQINNTDAQDDDVLLIGGSLPCTIKLTAAEKDMTVVLVAPKVGTTTRLSLSSSSGNNSDGSLTLTLPKSGSPVSFNISGVTGSNSVDDGAIEAHKDSASGDIKASDNASVYWFTSPKMTVEQGAGTYSDNLVDGKLFANSLAVYLTAEYKLMPTGVPTSRPELTNLKMGIVQNVMAGQQLEAVYSNPIWEEEDRIAGDSVNAGKTVTVTQSLPQADDVWNGDPGPLMHPAIPVSRGIMRGVDAPSWAPGSTFRLATFTALGRLTYVTYQTCDSINNTSNFVDWCATSDSSTGVVNALIESGWKLDVGTGKTNQKSQVGTEKPVQTNMVTTTNQSQFANQLGKTTPYYTQESSDLVVLHG